MYRWFILALSISVLFLTPGGCGGGGGGGGVGYVAPPPDPGLIDWGDYNTSDEASGYAAKSVTGVKLNGEEGVAETNDDIMSDPDYNDAMTDPSRVFYQLRIDWGQVVKDDAYEKGLKFSGSLTTDQGIILVTRLYRFDGEEAVVHPRAGAKTVEWQSSTGPHWDGIYFTIVTRPDDAYTQTHVTLDTVDYDRTFTLDELEAINETNVVDQYSNKVCIHGSKVKRDVIADGTVAGFWAEGEWIGRWINHDGTLAGQFVGHYDPDGQIFGKLVDMGGTFKGMLKGRWCYITHTNGPVGWFLGIYTNEILEPVGILGGHFIEGAAGEVGHLRGVWHEGFPYGFDPYNVPNPGDYKGTTPISL
jgi:hypothetical protein